MKSNDARRGGGQQDSRRKRERKGEMVLGEGLRSQLATDRKINRRTGSEEEAGGEREDLAAASTRRAVTADNSNSIASARGKLGGGVGWVAERERRQRSVWVGDR